VGTRRSPNEDTSFSRLLAQENCGGDGFEHDYAFDSVRLKHQLPTLTLCIGRGHSHHSRVSVSNDCNDGDWHEIARFAARSPSAALSSDILFCVMAMEGAGDVIRKAGHCSETEKLRFAVPGPDEASSRGVVSGPAMVQQRLPICVGQRAVTDGSGQHRPIVGAGAECEGELSEVSLRLEAPSLADLLHSMPSSGQGAPLFIVVEEEVPCFSFLCPNVLLHPPS